MDKFIRKLRRVSTHSYSITVPKKIIQKYGWRERQKMVIVDKGRGKLEIRDWRSK